VIADQLRMPIMWCEMGSCISWHADPEALGEADTRARAISAGWRIDAFGRLACPRCQQTDPGYRAARQVVPWDRYTARTAPIPAASGGRAASRSSRNRGRAVSGYPLATRTELEWHHDFPAGRQAAPLPSGPGPVPVVADAHKEDGAHGAEHPDTLTTRHNLAYWTEVAELGRSRA
jgi:hypothetical protein